MEFGLRSDVFHDVALKPRIVAIGEAVHQTLEDQSTISRPSIKV